MRPFEIPKNIVGIRHRLDKLWWYDLPNDQRGWSTEIRQAWNYYDANKVLERWIQSGEDIVFVELVELAPAEKP